MEEQAELTYVKGFNTGHKLQQYNPEIFERIKDSLSDTDEFERGLLEGAAQYNRDQEKSRLAELESLREAQEQEPEQEIEH